METGTLFAVTLLTYFLSGAHSATFTIKNHCSYTVWPGMLTGSGSQLPSTGFELAPQASNSLNVPAPWSGRVWGRSGCSNTAGKFSCRSGDCASGQVGCNGAGATPPATLIEFTLAPAGGKDFYDVSLVDGFNLPMSVTPQGGQGCSSASCPANLNARCPQELAVKSPDGSTVACKSACLAFNQPQYCCTGAYNSPDKCKPSTYSQSFKSQCPQAYSFAYDDKSSLLTCSGGANYLITFCP